jgi:hypothetical protein
MTVAALALGVILTTQATSPPHEGNPVYTQLATKGVELGGVHVAFPRPRIVDDATADAERKALLVIAGSERALDDLTRDSVNAPIIVKVRDAPDGENGVVRVVDVWFVVHANFDDVDPRRINAGAKDGETVEAGNMKFTAHRLTAPELESRKIAPPAEESDAREWFVHVAGRLLDRIEVEATDRITVSKGSKSWVVGSITDARFNTDGSNANRWRPVKKSPTDAEGSTAYPGGASYTTLTGLETVQGGLLVEGHAAFYEPKAWFNGAPILRSKIGVVAQDRVRSLRRELAKSRMRGGQRNSSSPSGR